MKEIILINTNIDNATFVIVKKGIIPLANSIRSVLLRRGDPAASTQRIKSACTDNPIHRDWGGVLF